MPQKPEHFFTIHVVIIFLMAHLLLFFFTFFTRATAKFDLVETVLPLTLAHKGLLGSYFIYGDCADQKNRRI